MRKIYNDPVKSIKKEFGTVPIQKGDHAALANTAAVIAKECLDFDKWNFIVNKGSLTFQHKEDRHRVVKIFMDPENTIAHEAGLKIIDNPVAIGVELTSQDPIIMESVRDKLSSLFGWQYLDPRTGYTRWWLKPQKEHFYDIVLLERGVCEFEIDSSLLEEFSTAIARQIKNEE